MNCAQPPELKDRELLAYLDGQAGPDISDHLDHCPACRRRAAGLARLEAKLAAGLFRAACPAPHELGEYHLGLLPAARAAAIETHLGGCPHCTAEVAQLRSYLSALAPEITPGVLAQAAQHVRVLLARLVAGGPVGSWPGLPAPSPAYAAVRGAGEGARLYHAGELQIAVEVQDDEAEPGRKLLLALISGADTHGWTATLWLAGQPATTVDVDDLGNLAAPGLAAGRYDLILAGPEVEIHVQDIDLA